MIQTRTMIRAAGLLLVSALAGCAEKSPVGENMPPVIGGPGNQSNPYKDINLENESANLDRLKPINTPGK